MDDPLENAEESGVIEQKVRRNRDGKIGSSVVIEVGDGNAARLGRDLVSGWEGKGDGVEELARFEEFRGET